MIWLTQVVLWLLGLKTLANAQVYPASYSYDNSLHSMVTQRNGSSPSRHCINSSSNGGTLTCHDPRTNSLLFDSITPCLCGTSTWASQLLILSSTSHIVDISFDFTTTPNYVGVQRMEISFFNCPQWGMGVSSITAAGGGNTLVVLNTHTTVSCSSLITACTDEISTTSSTFSLRFQLTQGSTWLHTAEIAFYSLNQQRSCLISKQVCAPFGIEINPPNISQPAVPMENNQVSTENNQVSTENNLVFTENNQVSTDNNQVSTEDNQVPKDNNQVPTSPFVNYTEEATTQKSPATSAPNCSQDLDYIILAVVFVVSALVTAVFSVPLTVLVTRKCCTATATFGQRSCSADTDGTLEFKAQSMNELDHIYAPVGIGNGSVEVTMNEAYAACSELTI